MNKKKVDVVIPVYHPGSEFKKLMERLERQTYEVNSIFLMHTTDGQSLESMKERYKNVTVEEILRMNLIMPQRETKESGNRMQIL